MVLPENFPELYSDAFREALNQVFLKGFQAGHDHLESFTNGEIVCPCERCVYAANDVDYATNWYSTLDGLGIPYRRK